MVVEGRAVDLLDPGQRVAFGIAAAADTGREADRH